MTKLLLTVGMLISTISVMPIAEAASYTRGYIRSNGTYVQPHFKSTRDNSFNNNWSTKGNYNPYTGSKGYKSWKY